MTLKKYVIADTFRGERI